MDGTRREGSLLVELVVSITVIALGLLALLFTFYASHRGTARAQELDDVRLALENAAETLRGAVFRDVYTNFHGQTLPAPGLLTPDGTSAVVEITCFVDEFNIPAEFGPVADLDGDGQLATADCSATYELLPVRLRVTYAAEGGVTETRELYLLLTEF